MADIHITKTTAAQRQLDASIRMLFGGEDMLATHTVAAAAINVLRDLSQRRAESMIDQILGEAYRTTISELLGKKLSDDSVKADLPKFKRGYLAHANRPQNFLKHADRDSDNLLLETKIQPDHLILEGCALFSSLGFNLTDEMWAFCRWYLAVYPNQDGDILTIGDGRPVHQLDRGEQLEFGQFLLELSHDQRKDDA